MEVLATTALGPVQGLVHPSSSAASGELLVFEGIPFGACERFRAATPPEPWGPLPLSCGKPGPIAPQPAVSLIPHMAASRIHFRNAVFRPTPVFALYC